MEKYKLSNLLDLDVSTSYCFYFERAKLIIKLKTKKRFAVFVVKKT